MKKIAVVGIPDKWSTEILADAIEAKTGFRLIVDMAKVTRDLTNNKLHYLGHDLADLDAMIVKKISTQYSANTEDRLELLRLAESDGIKVFSNPETMLRLVNRLSCTVSLRNSNIPMPDTVITEDIDVAVNTVERYGQAVFKPLFSTKARGMCLMSAEQPAKKLRKEIEDFQTENPMMYIQRRLDLSGQDIGLVFLGGQYLGAYARIANSADTWNTTIHSGGRYAAYTPSDEVIAIAKKAQDLFHLDFTTVDVAETADGPVVFEVSAFGGFRGAKEGAGLDAANLYADYVLGKIA
ncbi:MAG: GAK system ATP-grasp enzyme [Methylophilaceae bacterium]